MFTNLLKKMPDFEGYFHVDKIVELCYNYVMDKKPFGMTAIFTKSGLFMNEPSYNSAGGI